MDNENTGLLPPREEPTGSLRIYGDPSALFDALAKAQGEFTDIPRNKTVSVKTKAGFTYTFDYSTLDNTQSILRPILAKHGIAILQPPCDGSPYRVVTIMAGHGARMEIDFTLAKGEDIKAQAGAFTYAQRYQYEGILGVKADTDDDGNAASGDSATVADRGKSRQPPKPTPAPASAPVVTPPEATPKEKTSSQEAPVKPDLILVKDGQPTGDQRTEFKALCGKLGLTAKVQVAAKLQEIAGKTSGLTEGDTEKVLEVLRAEAGE